MKYTTYLLLILSWVSFNTVAQNNSELRKEYLEALDELTPYIPQISIKKWTECQGRTIILHTLYTCSTHKAKEALENYKNSFSKMETKRTLWLIWLSSITGLIGAASMIKTSTPTKEPLLPVAAILTLLPAIVGIHHKQQKALPYYDNDLNYKKNYFGLENSITDAAGATFVASLLALIGWGCYESYHSTHPEATRLGSTQWSLILI